MHEGNRIDDLARGIPAEGNPIEAWAKAEYQDSVSAGAAARQLCRTLGCFNAAPTLKNMLEDMLSQANEASHDRYLILKAFIASDPQAGLRASAESFRRINRIKDGEFDLIVSEIDSAEKRIGCSDEAMGQLDVLAAGFPNNEG